MKITSAFLAGTVLVQIICAAPNKHFLRNHGTLTEPTTENAGDVGNRFLRNAAAFYGVPESDLSSLYLVREFRTDHNGVTHLRYRQRYDGIDVAESDFTINLDSDGRILNAGGAMFARPNIQVPRPRDAMLGPSMRVAMNSVDPSAAHDYTPMEIAGKGTAKRFHRPQQGDIDAKPVWFPIGERLEPAWQFVLDAPNRSRQSVTIHSETQAILETRPLTIFQSPPAPPRGLVFTGQSPRPNPNPGAVDDGDAALCFPGTRVVRGRSAGISGRLGGGE